MAVRHGGIAYLRARRYYRRHVTRTITIIMFRHNRPCLPCLATMQSACVEKVFVYQRTGTDLVNYTAKDVRMDEELPRVVSCVALIWDAVWR